MIPQGFLDAILANPGDDTPRLILADWLEEHGQEERAEFIRVGVEIVGTPIDHEPIRKVVYGIDQPPCPCDWCVLKRRGKELATRYGSVWGGKLAEIPDAEGEYRRGFIAEVICHWKDWQKHGPTLVRQQPIEVVKFSDRDSSYTTTPQNTSEYGWGRGQPEQRMDNVGDDIWQMLGGEIRQDRNSWKFYITEDEANTDLSRAALLWAKSQPVPL